MAAKKATSAAREQARVKESNLKSDASADRARKRVNERAQEAEDLYQCATFGKCAERKK